MHRFGWAKFLLLFYKQRVNETINILSQINAECYVPLQHWCSYLKSGLCKVRLIIHFSFSKNYLHTEGACNFFGCPVKRKTCWLQLQYLTTKFYFILPRAKYVFSPQLKVCLFAGFLSQSSETIQFYDCFVYKYTEYKSFSFNFIRVK